MFTRDSVPDKRGLSESRLGEMFASSSSANIIGSMRRLEWMNLLFISKYRFPEDHKGGLIIFTVA